jgi:pimeloyl-ACP methyl ester carboxylesterase
MKNDFSVKSGKALLYGESCGAGPCVVMLHAGVADRRMWRDTLAYVGESNLALAYDRRGFGKTLSPDEPFSHIEDLDRVIGNFGCEQVTLIGCSQGGRIAIDYVLAHPSKVAALVLVATAITGASAPNEYPREIAKLLADLDDAESKHDHDRINAIEARLWLDGPLGANERIGGNARQLFLDMNGHALRQAPFTREQPCESAMDRVHGLTAPTLVIWGTLDFPHIQLRSQWIAETIPHAKSFTMDGCAHLPNLEQPAQFNSAVAAFIHQSAKRR